MLQDRLARDENDQCEHEIAPTQEEVSTCKAAPDHVGKEHHSWVAYDLGVLVFNEPFKSFVELGGIWAAVFVNWRWQIKEQLFNRCLQVPWLVLELFLCRSVLCRTTWM